MGLPDYWSADGNGLYMVQQSEVQGIKQNAGVCHVPDCGCVKIPVWKLLENPGDIHEMLKPKIDRKGRLYWYIRRNEAERLWNETYSQSEGDWKTQGKKKQREFLDRLYLERINKQEMEETENEQTTY